MAKETAGRILDLPLLVMALGATLALGVFVGSQVEVSRCRDLGGRVMHYGLDRVCTQPDGSTVPITVMPQSRAGQATIAVTALAAAGAIYRGMLRIVRPGRKHA